MRAQAAGPAADTALPGAGPSHRHRRPGRIVAGAVFLAATGGAAAAGLGLGAGGEGGSGGGAGDGLPPRTAEVTRQTLVDSTTVDARLGHGPTADATARVAGTLTSVPASGGRVGRGEALYEVDDAPVTLLYGGLPAYRALEPGTEGADVEQLERNLSALGYTGFTVDEAYSAATAGAVREWQEDLGVAETGTVELGRVVFAPGAVLVDSVEAQRGDLLAPGTRVLAYTGTARAVTAELDTADRRLAKRGTAVEVRLPDGTAVAGVVDRVTMKIREGEQQEQVETVIEVVVRLRGAKAREAAANWPQASVHVAFAAGRRENVLTVPVAALVALAEGGFGVEVVRDRGTEFVPVDTGLFAHGRVEISGAGVAEGQKVGMPK